MSIRVGAIIAAAGDGSRFSKKGEKRKKQFIVLGGKPLFLHISLEGLLSGGFEAIELLRRAVSTLA